MESSQSGRTSIILLLLLVLLAAVLIYTYMRTSMPAETPVAHTPERPAVRIVRADVGVTTLPPGFPTTIPVGDIITESYKETDIDKSTTKYVVTFVTKKTASVILGVYNDYLTRDGYTISSTSASMIEGQKGASLLTATVTPSVGTESRVSVNLLVH